MRLQPLRADRDGHRHLDDRGSRLREHRLREHHRAHPVRRRRGIRRRLRRHPDVHPARHRDDLGARLLLDSVVPNVSALHLDSDGEASNRGSDEVHPGPEPDGDRPARELGGFHPALRPDELRPDPESAVRHRGGDCREPGVEPDAPLEPRSTGCYRPEAPWDLASVPVRLASVRQVPIPSLRRPVPAEPGSAEPGTGSQPLEPPVLPLRQGPELRVPVLPELQVPGLPELRVPQLQVPQLRALLASDARQAWGPDADRQAWRLCSAWVRSRSRCRSRTASPTSRTGMIHVDDALQAPRRWTKLI